MTGRLSERGTGLRGNAALLERKMPRLNALDYGVVGDGVTDDSAAIMALLALGVGTGKHFYFPAGTYRLATVITVPFIPTSAISGDGPWLTIFQPDNGVGAFRFRTDLTHGITCKGFGVHWATQQTTLAATAFHYGVTGGTAAGFYSHSYTDITVWRAYNGWALDASDGQQCIWNTAWKNCRLYRINNSAFWLAPAVATGMPELSFDHIFIENTSSIPIASAFNFLACEVTMTNIGIESWYGHTIIATGGGFCTINGLHIEHWRAAEAFSYCIYAADNTPLSINGFNIAGATTAGCTDSVQIFRRLTNSRMLIANGEIGVDTTLGSAYIKEVIHTSNDLTTAVSLTNVRVSSGGINAPLAGSRATESTSSLIVMGMLASSSRVGIAAPIFKVTHLEALPTAAVAYRGEVRMVHGAAGVLDRLVVCRKDAANAYAWVDLF